MNKTQSSGLIVKDLSVSYPTSPKPVVEHVSFELKPGSLNVLIGPNGSGKSTILKAIIGALPHKGKISFFDEFHIGYVPQRLELDLSLPIQVREFLMLTLISCKHTTAEKNSFIKQALRRVGASTLIDKTLGQLSGGQLQRVILARALVHHPKLLLLDEPESGIDIQGEKIIYDLLKTLIDESNLTVLIATHELEMVHKYADQVFCINKKLICAGGPDIIFESKSMEKLFGKNRVRIQHVH